MREEQKEAWRRLQHLEYHLHTVTDDLERLAAEAESIRKGITVTRNELRDLWNEEEMWDITGAELVEIVIRDDGKVIWVNTEEGCILRICQIENVRLYDKRE